MTYACEDCGFLFCRVGAVKECPSCEKNHIRSATKEEAGRLQKLLEQGKPVLRIKEIRSYEQTITKYVSGAVHGSDHAAGFGNG